MMLILIFNCLFIRPRYSSIALERGQAATESFFMFPGIFSKMPIAPSYSLESCQPKMPIATSRMIGVDKWGRSYDILAFL